MDFLNSDSANQKTVNKMSCHVMCWFVKGSKVFKLLNWVFGEFK